MLYVCVLQQALNKMLSQTLLTHVESVRGVDLSGKMVARYNEAVRAAGILPEQMSAVRADIMADDPNSPLAAPDYHNFDLAVVSMALHHIENPRELLTRLVRLLKAGGVLVVIDWLPDAAGGHHHHEHGHGHGHGHDHSHQHGSTHAARKTWPPVQRAQCKRCRPYHRSCRVHRERYERLVATSWLLGHRLCSSREAIESAGKHGRTKAAFFCEGQQIVVVCGINDQ